MEQFESVEQAATFQLPDPNYRSSIFRVKSLGPSGSNIFKGELDDQEFPGGDPYTDAGDLDITVVTNNTQQDFVLMNPNKQFRSLIVGGLTHGGLGKDLVDYFLTRKQSDEDMFVIAQYRVPPAFGTTASVNFWGWNTCRSGKCRGLKGDDFNQASDLDNYMIRGGSWGISAGSAVQSSNNTALLVHNNSIDTGCVNLNTRIRSADNDIGGLVFLYRGTNDYYYAAYDEQHSRARIVKRQAGVETVLAEKTLSLDWSSWHQIRVEFCTDQSQLRFNFIYLYIDFDTQLFARPDTNFIQFGQVGLYTKALVGATFSHFRVTNTPVYWYDTNP